MTAAAGPPGPQSPWPPGAADLLLQMLTRFGKLAELASRHSLLERMDHAAGRALSWQASFRLNVPEHNVAIAHLRAIVRAAEEHADPTAALTALRTALHDLWPQDKALPWLQLTALAMSGRAPLAAEPALGLVLALYPVEDLEPARRPTADQLYRHIPHGVRGAMRLSRPRTLPEIVLHLCDVPEGSGSVPLMDFLTGIAHDDDLAAYEELGPLRRVLATLDTSAGPARFPEGDRLIIQIRVEAMGPEYMENVRYELRGAYYLQSADDGSLRHLGSLPPSSPLRRHELTDADSAPLSDWARQVLDPSAADRAVRVEFLLPASLLGSAPEAWSAGPAGTPLGQRHPVVVRSLERYIDAWLDPEPWRRRWWHLHEDTNGLDALDRIAWPLLVTELREGLARRPELACLGLPTPYDALTPEEREAVRDALFLEGVPAMIWRRDPGGHQELVAALRGHPPGRLCDLPETVHHCRKQGGGGGTDVHDHITLLWDDPQCVDADQDMPFPGMA